MLILHMFIAWYRRPVRCCHRAGSSHDQGVLTKEQERELRMYVAQLSHVSNIDIQQSLLQEVRFMIAQPPAVA